MSTPPLLPYARQSIDDEDVEAVAAALRGDWLTQGPTVQQFEEALSERCGAPYCVAVSSGTAALHLASLAAGVRSGDFGVAPDVTFVATANGLRYAGGAPVLADVDARTGLATSSTMRAATDHLRDRGHAVRALIPVGLAGSVPDLPSISALARELGAMVIEDAAHSLGATYLAEGGERRAASCSHSDFAILSFHPVKHITTLEGGAVLCRDLGAYRELLELRSHGITRDPARLTANDGPWYYEQRRLGFHYRLSDVACALGLSQLRRLEDFLARRRAIAAHYERGFEERGLGVELEPLTVPSGVRSAYHLYVVKLRNRPDECTSDVSRRRRALYESLATRGVRAQVHYIPLHRQPDFAAFARPSDGFPGADDYYARCISLPMFPAMTAGDVERVLDAISGHFS